MPVRARIEFKREDCWVGVYWRRSSKALDVWICLVPMLPLHLTFTKGPNDAD